MTRRTMTALVLLASFAAPAVAQDDGPEMQQQRCVWACLANSPGVDSAEYKACLKQYCEVIGTDPVAEAPAPAAKPKAPAGAKPPRKRPAEMSQATPGPAAPDPAAPALPRLADAPEAAPDASTSWQFGRTSDGEGYYAGTRDAALGSGLNWLCGHGAQSLLALSPYQGDGKVVFTVQGRPREVQLQVENGVGYVPIGFSAPLFIHIAAGPEVEVTDSTGVLLGRFTLLDAPLAIGQAEGRCQSGA